MCYLRNELGEWVCFCKFEADDKLAGMRFWCLAVVLVLSTKSDDRPPPRFREIVDPEVYDFYSSVIRAEGLGPRERVAIVAVPMLFAESFHCTSPLSAEDQKLIDTARANSKQLWFWDGKFHFGSDSILVNMNEVHAAIGCVAAGQEHQAPGKCHAYGNVRDIRALSIPVFNSNHTRALVTQASYLRNVEELAIYQKKNNVWKPDRRALALCEWSFSIR